MTADNAPGWRTIESAPRDGTRVLVWWRDREISVTSFDGPRILATLAEAGATHWMPLPAPPPEPGA